MKLDPEMKADYYLGSAFVLQGKYEEARAVPGKVAQDDPQHGNAQALLKSIGGK